jgi:hypothetical protein
VGNQENFCSPCQQKFVCCDIELECLETAYFRNFYIVRDSAAIKFSVLLTTFAILMSIWDKEERNSTQAEIQIELMK